MSDRPNWGRQTRRRFLGTTGVAGIATLAGCGSEEPTETGAPSDDPTDTPTETATEVAATAERPGGTYDPGPPRFVQVGEQLTDPIFTDAGHGFDRDNFAPGVANPQRDPENYGAEAFTWTLAEQPADSEAELLWAPNPYGDTAQYDAGTHNTAELVPDAPGRYVLELEAPDGTYRQTVHAFPAEPANPSPPPALSLSAELDAEEEVFVVDPNASLSGDSNATPADLEVAYLPADGSGLEPDAIEVDDDHRAHVPVAALDGPTSIYAAAYDGATHSVTDEIELHPAEPAVALPNRPPEWLDDAVIYEIFTRSFAGAHRETDFAFLESKADYLAELGVDVVWLTPILPAHTADVFEETGDYPPGGPHAYSAGDYFDVADDLGTLEAYDAFVDACHERDIKVCFDLVINHCGWTNPMFQDTIASTGPDPAESYRFPEITAWNRDSKYFDWFDRMATGGYDAAPAQTSFFGVRLQPNLNYGNVALREQMLAVADFWADRVDAFRCDIAWGVPHSFWKEVRDLVKAKDAEFLLLDETIPNDPSFAESEFDVHFDTADFMVTAKNVARGSAEPNELVSAVQGRRDEGFPRHTRLVNAVENHDESRLYYEAKENGSREDPAKAQRAAAAACFTLPGIPFVYYGQERLVSEYGERRTSPFADDPNMADDIEADPYKRAFMTWAEDGDTVPEAHLAYYKSLIAHYHDSDVLGPDAEIRRAWHRVESTNDVLAFGLENGAAQRVVLVNFDPGTAQVTLREAVSTADAFTGTDIAVGTGEGTVTVGVDTVAVLETPSLHGLGDGVVTLPDPTGDDDGPGDYTYPSGVADGALDLTEVAAYETRDSYQFAVRLDGPIENPRGYESGFSAQQFQFYLSNGKGLWGDDVAREGVNVAFPELYQYRIVADGEHGVRVETGLGDEVATGDCTVLPDDRILIEFPKRAITGSLSAMGVAPLVLGYDPDAPGNVYQVEGGAGTEPNVFDLLVPEGTSQAEALEYTANALAEVPYTPMTAPFEQVTTWSDPTGDDHGPGSYTYPTSDDFYANAFDATGFSVEESRDRVRFAFEMAEPVQNPWGLGNGFSHQFFQVYLRDPNAPSDQQAGTEARLGVDTGFEQPYHYRVVAHGNAAGRVEVPGEDGGETVTNETKVAVVDETTVAIEFPKDAIGGDVRSLELVPLVCPFDGYGEGSVRGVAAEKAEWVFGGGVEGDTDPKVLDLFTPDGVSQAEALAYTTDSLATVPFLDVDG